jgi:hypothetical protein
LGGVHNVSHVSFCADLRRNIPEECFPVFRRSMMHQMTTDKPPFSTDAVSAVPNPYSSPSFKMQRQGRLLSKNHTMV